MQEVDAVAATEQHDLAATYGLRALVTVVFDIDSGQKLDALYPPTCGLSEAAKTSLAHLSLPHCNNQDEGDTQFIVRFRDNADESYRWLCANCRPDVVYDTPVVLPLAGTYISCIIPRLLDYEHLDSTYESDSDSPLHSHFIVEGHDDAMDTPDFYDFDDDDDGEVDTEETILVKGGKFVVAKRQHPPSPSFGDLLLSKRTHQSTPFEVWVIA
ncbi:unnamed protein product [Phytophthora fragariaefolia]|uniref:Unnamed protein product n=1 Tax=Phytophthora fragariaefolia TaxID=1490495 RepID=A0A9W6YEU7_9STRA|nr:unnamed protein product [Phytophthora fragariaefolia]